MKRFIGLMPICCSLLALGLFISACKKEQPTDPIPIPDYVGVYSLISIDGKPVPASVIQDGVTLQIHSGTFTINANGTCSSKMTVVPQSGTEVTQEVMATYTISGSTLTMQWQGAGRTTGTVDGNTFTMDNEGVVLVYRK